MRTSSVSTKTISPLKTDTSEPPGPPGLPLIGNFLTVQRDPLGTMARVHQKFGDVARMRLGPYNFVLLNDPADIRHVLVKNHGNYHKSPTYELLRPILGNGLVTSEGSFWRRQRKLAQPAFHHKRLIGFAETMTALSLEMVEQWSAQPRGIDAHQAMMNLTLRIVGHTLMSTEFGGDASSIGRALTTVLEFFGNNQLLLFLPTWFPLPGKRKAAKACETLDQIVLNMIETRRQSTEEHHDLMAILMAATGEDDEDRMTDLQLRDELMTMVLAGHETTANALSWAIYLLGKHPDVAAKLRMEVDEVLEGRPPTLEDLGNLEYVDCVIKEAMRVYPPVWIYERLSLGDDRLGGYDVAKGSVVAICPWTLHRNPEVFPDPERFDPERFRPAVASERDKYAYLPFGTGPRTCIGNAFAMMEAKIILSVIAQRFDLSLRPGQRIVPEPGVTLRPKSGVWIDALPRR